MPFGLATTTSTSEAPTPFSNVYLRTDLLIGRNAAGANCWRSVGHRFGAHQFDARWAGPVVEGGMDNGLVRSGRSRNVLYTMTQVRDTEEARLRGLLAEAAPQPKKTSKKRSRQPPSKQPSNYKSGQITELRMISGFSLFDFRRPLIITLRQHSSFYRPKKRKR